MRARATSALNSAASLVVAMRQPGPAMRDTQVTPHERHCRMPQRRPRSQPLCLCLGLLVSLAGLSSATGAHNSPSAAANGVGSAMSPSHAALPSQLASVTLAGTTPYAVGHSMGSQLRAQMQQAAATPMVQALVTFCATPGNHSETCASLLRNANASFPEVVLEMRGIADGSGLSFATVWAVNVMDEIHMVNQSYPHASVVGAAPSRTHKAPPSACTTVLNATAPSGTSTAAAPPSIGHNEDGGMCLFPVGTLAMATAPNDARGAWTAFVYPLMVPGYAFGVNAHGFGFTLNSLFAKYGDVVHGVPNAVLARDLLTSTSADDAARRLMGYTAAAGFAVNVGGNSASDATPRGSGGDASPADGASSAPNEPAATETAVSLTTWEIAAHGLHAVRHYGGAWPPVGYHFNEYVMLSVQQVPDLSSDHRTATTRRLLGEGASMRRILGDTSDRQYPVYRDGVAPDDCVTAATALLQFGDASAGARQLVVYEFGNPTPGDGVKPAAVYPF